MIPGGLIGGKYRLLRRLGRGAMGEVWAAVNEDTEREVALKLITSPDPELRRRLKREARAIGRLEHPHIVQILDMGETDAGEPFLVMERLSGETLADRLRRDRVLPPAVAAAIALDVARALRVAHEKQIVHRDLKPANIFLHREPDTDEDVVKVVDFGVSKMAIEHEGGGTVTGGIIGSPAYMSPEQIRGVGVDGRSDIWALGVLLFEMIAGDRPFPGMQPVVVLGQILSMPVPRVETAAPHVDAGLGDVIADCLERDPDKRVASAAELAKRLRPFAPRGPFATMGDPGARERFTSFTQLPSSTDAPSPLHGGVAERPSLAPDARSPVDVRRASGTMSAVRAPAPDPDREVDVPTAVFQPSALLGAVRPAPPRPGPPRGEAAGEVDVPTAVFRPAAALRMMAAKADAPPPAPAEDPVDEPTLDEVARTNEIDRTLPRMAAPSAPAEIPPAPVAALEDAGNLDADLDAPTGRMSPEARQKFRTTQPLDPAMVPRFQVMRGLTMPLSASFVPPNPAAPATPAAGWNAAPGAAVTTTNSPMEAPPFMPSAQEAPFFVPEPAVTPRWHTALLVFSAVALIAAVVMLALTLGGDGSVTGAPPAGSSLAAATGPAASASASASTSTPAPDRPGAGR